ncbi:hypothetical protein ATCC90586_006046 [Pythium insidiosum]|nr:hypothetical protein ATCC90586_006046 [Pythium insidiosum]
MQPLTFLTSAPPASAPHNDTTVPYTGAECSMVPTITTDCANPSGLNFTACLVRMRAGSQQCEILVRCTPKPEAKEPYDALVCEGGRVGRVTSLPALLSRVTLTGNALEAFQAPDKNSRLKQMYIDGNNITTLVFHDGLADLEFLSVVGTLIRKIELRNTRPLAVEQLRVEAISVHDITVPSRVRTLNVLLQSNLTGFVPPSHVQGELHSDVRTIDGVKLPPNLSMLKLINRFDCIVIREADLELLRRATITGDSDAQRPCYHALASRARPESIRTQRGDSIGVLIVDDDVFEKHFFSSSTAALLSGPGDTSAAWQRRVTHADAALVVLLMLRIFLEKPKPSAYIQYLMSAKHSAVVWTSEGDRRIELKPPQAPVHEHGRPQWEPYDFNGGTVLAIAGKDFVVMAADTRLSTGYSILSRNESKVHAITPTTLLGCPGSHNDIIQLRGVLSIRAQMYRHDNGVMPSAESTAQLLMNTLYSRRFFPYYAFCLLAGIDKDGKGALYSYDALGSHDRVTRGAMGSGGHLMIPLLDNLVEHESRTDPKKELSIQETKEIIKDAFVTAGERDIYTGDSIEIFTITAAGVAKDVFELKKD